ncbi:MAG: hypothetical protein CM1200mP30_10760 [Pseudomonadota bacterium]|nr:MAG: hypothetical protein CM1200mP30_10760 [Pseudomonadota bacterium]
MLPLKDRLGGAVIFASGFNEEKDGVDFALKLDHAAGDIPFIGPNCYGFANFFDPVALWPDQVTGEFVKRGVAFHFPERDNFNHCNGSTQVTASWLCDYGWQPAETCSRRCDSILCSR